MLVDKQSRLSDEHLSNAETLVRFLEDEGFRGWYRNPDMQAGANIRESITSAAIESEYIIFMLQNQPSEDFLNEITNMHRIPERKEKFIIIEDGKDVLNDQTVSLPALSINETISTSEQNWEDEVLKRLMTTHIGELLFYKFIRV